jgi:hypothetical protein
MIHAGWAADRCYDYMFPKFGAWNSSVDVETHAMDLSDNDANYNESSIIYGGKEGSRNLFFAMRSVASVSKLKWLITLENMEGAKVD